MNKITNQDIERNYFEKFRKDYPLPPGTIVYGDSPDVIIEGQRRIGIEVTSFFLEEGSLPQSEQAQRKLREKVVSQAERIFRAAHGKKIEITFAFDKAGPTRDWKNLVKAIVELANEIQGSNTGVVEKDVYKAIPELSYVYLNAQEYDDPKWRLVHDYDGGIMSGDRLLNIVRTKELRAGKYKTCDAYWLLVVVDFMNPAQDQEIRIDGFRKLETEVFERVIIYKTLLGHMLEAK